MIFISWMFQDRWINFDCFGRHVNIYFLFRWCLNSGSFIVIEGMVLIWLLEGRVKANTMPFLRIFLDIPSILFCISIDYYFYYSSFNQEFSIELSTYLCLNLIKRFYSCPIRTETKDIAPAINKMANEIKELISLPGSHSFFALTLKNAGSNWNLKVIAVVIADSNEHHRYSANEASKIWK